MIISIQILELSIYTHLKEHIGFVILDKFYFDSYGCAPPESIKNYIKSKYKSCIFSQYQIQNFDSLCASYCLYIIYCVKICVKILLLDYKKAVLVLFYSKLND